MTLKLTIKNDSASLRAAMEFYQRTTGGDWSADPFILSIAPGESQDIYIHENKKVEIYEDGID